MTEWPHYLASNILYSFNDIQEELTQRKEKKNKPSKT